MGAYRNESDYIRETRSQWNTNSNMESGGIGNLVDKFSEIGVHSHQHQESTPKDNSLFQVMKAVEAAETTIKQQVEENNRLRVELQKRTQELDRYKSDESSSPRLQSDGLQDEHVQGSYKAQRFENTSRNQDDRVRWTDNATVLGSQGALVLQQNGAPRSEHPAVHTFGESQHYTESNKLNGTLSQLSSPSPRSYSPNRYLREREFDSKMNLFGQGLVPVSEQDSQSSPWKKELVLKVREHEEEILQLRKHLGEYSIREAQIRNEKYALEKRIAYMRMAFDQQQQDLVDAASKSLSYRQDIIEENIRLTYALQAAQQERSIFISSLLPLLEDYSLQPPVLDAQSIVSNLKVLFKHLQEKLILTEAKLKESHYQLAPWRSESLNPPIFTPQSQSQAQSPSRSPALNTSNKNGLELVPQPAYSHSQTPISARANAPAATDWNSLGQHTHQTDFVGDGSKSPEPDNLGQPFPSTSRNPATQDVSLNISQGGFHNKHFSEENAAKQLSFNNDYLGSGGMDDPDAVGLDSGREPSPHWSSGNSPYMTPTHDDPGTSYSPYLPAVLEEPSSSFSEAAEDDPLPGIEGLQISGEAFPGRDLQACGYSVNGTTSCNFEWVRYREDGSVHYIEGAKQPNYLVTADDVDSYLAIHVQPLDNRKRKGELVKVFANEQIKIALDPDMQEQIEKTLHSGHASYEVSVAVGYLDIWEPAILAIKREGYSIKCNGPRGVVVTEKFLPITAVTIPYGSPTAFSISGAGGVEHPLKTTDSSALRDTIVLTMRLFIMRAVEKRKGKKKGLFFHK
ncbi:uncharacterized protein LOC113282402 isoform X2 [Papaver somniferum]|uniref:uncharacterized protein LOC113282402 isoform X2 n=1 Tax=Papaver somniferum TaxID=3469 RepID=UPI000E704D47|nr:uncharacterized protein LOC113282402 isoform X2 [Papaver somniferum]